MDYILIVKRGNFELHIRYDHATHAMMDGWSAMKTGWESVHFISPDKHDYNLA